MEQTQINQFHADLIFDFGEYLNSGLMSDCTLVFPDGRKIKAHKIILATSSKFLHDAFTSGMHEDTTGEVTITFNPQNLLPQVIDFIYTSLIEITDENCMPLIEISHFYGIQNLYDFIISKFTDVVSPSNILHYVDICYNLELNEALKVLVPFMARFYRSIPIEQFSDKLDIATFCHVLTIVANDPSFESDIVAELNTFLNGAQPNAEQKEELDKLLILRTDLVKSKPSW
ncbi:BTB/POZ domain containing protein [Tritrichomonas foetus]|uniref:BTB/POZ domain containing protein n=1 Tax=Tritrichomonas foetus TaxID=1144522 RepID=A0A1J4J536_9EUKA|nr:BTB/POZ domain containing protein [Tritrichomonas foetus]|eukprot:OHS93263.1 BTB/POZ domain containing protein [Tritrichomonas foetus]